MGVFLSGRSTPNGRTDHPGYGQQAIAQQWQQQNGDTEEDVHLIDRFVSLFLWAPVTTGAPVDKKSFQKSRNRP
jgi:hypothetical protein